MGRLRTSVIAFLHVSDSVVLAHDGCGGRGDCSQGEVVWETEKVRLLSFVK